MRRVVGRRGVASGRGRRSCSSGGGWVRRRRVGRSGDDLNRHPLRHRLIQLLRPGALGVVDGRPRRNGAALALQGLRGLEDVEAAEAADGDTDEGLRVDGRTVGDGAIPSPRHGCGALGAMGAEAPCSCPRPCVRGAGTGRTR